MEREKLIEEMTKIVGKENVLSSETDLLLYGYDASLFRGKPDCIVLPGSTEEVSKIVKFAHEAGIHVLGTGVGDKPERRHHSNTRWDYHPFFKNE